jgi:hypothetical protein
LRSELLESFHAYMLAVKQLELLRLKKVKVNQEIIEALKSHSNTLHVEYVKVDLDSESFSGYSIPRAMRT